MTNEKLIIMVTSIVCGIGELLNQIYAFLVTIGYEVWMQQEPTTINTIRGRKVILV